MKTLFLMNPEPEAKKLNLEFNGRVKIHGVSDSSDQSYGKCFETELPPLSVIPMSLFVERTQTSLETDKVEENGTSAELA